MPWNEDQDNSWDLKKNGYFLIVDLVTASSDSYSFCMSLHVLS